MFSEVVEIKKRKHFSSNVKGYEFKGTEGSTLVCFSVPIDPVPYPEEYIQAVLDGLIVDSKIADLEDADGRCVVYTGYTDEEKNEVFYSVIRLDYDTMYVLDARFPKSNTDIDQQRKNYYTECLYRGAGFSITKQSLRSYDDYLDDEGLVDEEYESTNGIQSVTEAESVEW